MTALHPTAARFAERLLCAGDRRVAAQRLGLRSASPDQARSWTGFSIDESLRRSVTVWCAGGTPHAVFEIDTETLIAAIPGGVVVDVA